MPENEINESGLDSSPNNFWEKIWPQNTHNMRRMCEYFESNGFSEQQIITELLNPLRRILIFYERVGHSPFLSGRDLMPAPGDFGSLNREVDTKNPEILSLAEPPKEIAMLNAFNSCYGKQFDHITTISAESPFGQKANLPPAAQLIYESLIPHFYDEIRIKMTTRSEQNSWHLLNPIYKKVGNFDLFYGNNFFDEIGRKLEQLMQDLTANAALARSLSQACKSLLELYAKAVFRKQIEDVKTLRPLVEMLPVAIPIGTYHEISKTTPSNSEHNAVLFLIP